MFFIPFEGLEVLHERSMSKLSHLIAKIERFDCHEQWSNESVISWVKSLMRGCTTNSSHGWAVVDLTGLVKVIFPPLLMTI